MDAARSYACRAAANARQWKTIQQHNNKATVSQNKKQTNANNRSEERNDP